MPVDAYRPFPTANTYIWPMDAETVNPSTGVRTTPGWDLAGGVTLQLTGQPGSFGPIRVPGQFDQAYRYRADGAGAYNYARQVSPAAIILLGDRYSVDFWYRLGPLLTMDPIGGGYYPLVHLGNPYNEFIPLGSGMAVKLEVDPTATTAHLRFDVGDGVDFASLDSDPLPLGDPFPVIDQVWHHAACVLNGSTLISYHDGEENGRLATAFTYTAGSVADLWVGPNYGGVAFPYYYDITIDSLRIVGNQALPESFWKETVNNGPMLTRT